MIRLQTPSGVALPGGLAEATGTCGSPGVAGSADRHEVSRESLTRATRLLHALASEAQRRGHDVTPARHGPFQYNSAFRRRHRSLH